MLIFVFAEECSHSDIMLGRTVAPGYIHGHVSAEGTANWKKNPTSIPKAAASKPRSSESPHG